MKVALTGASGYLGSRLCNGLLKEGHSVRAIVRPTSDLSSLPSFSGEQEGVLEIVYGDVTDLTSLLNAFEGCEVVFHTAAIVEPWIPDPSLFFTVNVEGLKNVIEAVKQTSSVKKLVYTSSFFALGPTDGCVADEKQVHRGKFFCTEYERSKALADSVARQAAVDGLPIIIVYPGVIYGPGKITAGNLLSRMMIERFSGRLPGYVGGERKYSFCNVDDVALGHIAAMEKGRIGERYLFSGENASFCYVFDVAADVTRTRRPIFHIPLWLVEVYGWINVLWARLSGKLPLISYPVVQVMRHDWAYSCQKAMDELHYKPRNLREGIAEMLLWLKDSSKIKY